LNVFAQHEEQILLVLKAIPLVLSQDVKNKWMLVVKTIPIVLFSLGLRFVVTEVIRVHLTLKFSDLAPILTGVSVILGLMLTGVITDYKEAEKLPATISRSLDDLDGLSRRGLQRVNKNSSWAHERVLHLTEVVHDWFCGRVSNDDLWRARSDMGEMILELDRNDVPDYYMHRLLRVNSDLGAALSRVQVIRDTDFISAGYALMELLVGGVIVTLSIVAFSTPLIGFCITGGLTLIYAYLVRLSKDIDNPFEHGKNLGRGSAADVDLTPFLAVRAKLQNAQVVRLSEDAL
jgi:hypothetical protein